MTAIVCKVMYVVNEYQFMQQYYLMIDLMHGFGVIIRGALSLEPTVAYTPLFLNHSGEYL